MRLLISIIVLIGLLVVNCAVAQSIPKPDYNNCADFLLANPVEKLYLHTDRDVFAENDTIWFKAYLLNAHTMKIDNAPLRNVYVELLTESMEVAVRNMLAMKSGISFGDFNLSSYRLRPGKYKLRAYTAYQTNFDEGFIFQKNILITPVYNQNAGYAAFADSIGEAQKLQASSLHVDFQFMPEGGQLTAGIDNVLAFKALYNNGLGVSVKGEIFDNNHERVASFQTCHAGMGKVQFKPEKGKTYYARIDCNHIEYPLPLAGNSVLMNVSQNDQAVIVRLKANTMEIEPVWYHLVVSSRGLVVFTQRILVDKPFLVVRIPHSELNMGINQITLLNSELIPFCNRLVFVEKKGMANLEILAERDNYKLRDSVRVTIKASGSDGRPIKGAALSVSAIDEMLARPLNGHQQNIYTWLLVDSDLKGHVENPSYYFNSENEMAAGHLDLLMLTQGWSRYTWNALLDSLPEIKVRKQFGIELTGTLTQGLFGRKLKNTALTLSMMHENEQFYENLQTDSEGNFKISNLVIPDSMQAYFACPDKSKLNQSVTVQTFAPEYPVGSFVNFSIPEKGEMDLFYKQSVKRYIEDKTFYPDKYDILIGEVTVSERIKPEDIKDDHFRPYSKADRVLMPTEDQASYQNVLYYLNRQMGRVKYYGDTMLFISGLSMEDSRSEISRTPMLLLDGIEVELIDIENLPMSVVDKVEVLTERTSLAMWPSDSRAGRNGVISVYTKRVSAYDAYTKSQLSHVLRGYYPSRAFYSPKYVGNSNEGAPDFRTTLLWAPFLVTDEQGQSAFTFFTSDNATSISISAEGITAEGIPVVANKKLLVE